MVKNRKIYKLGNNNIEIVKEISFTSERKRMSTIIESFENDGYRIFTKGAPETMKN